jgi:NAD(P)-dependent dehydrogenase (short-subunit alcohol dehydrogenase family)
MDFSGKIVFVTAAANGIGLGICRALARSGVNLVLADQRAQLDIAREELSSFNIRTRAIELDASDAEAFARPPDQAEPRFGNIHFLFNNAA